jgi:hypothetical protein
MLFTGHNGIVALQRYIHPAPAAEPDFDLKGL